MEIVLALAIIGVGLIWYYNAKSKSAPDSSKQDQSHLAPYKIEPPQPVIEVAPAPVPAQDIKGNWPFPGPVDKATPPKAKKPEIGRAHV